MTINARLVQLRQIFSDQDPIEVRWAALCVLFEGWSYEPGFDVLLEYADAHMRAQSWPDEARARPAAWVERASQSTVGRPEWLLARSLTRQVGIDLRRFDALARNSGLRHLTRLSIRCGMADQHLRMLMEKPWPSLQHLDLSGNELQPGGAVFLSRTTALPSLKSLDLTGNLVASPGALALASPHHMPELHSVNLTRCGVDRDTLARLASGKSPVTFYDRTGGIEAGGVFYHTVRIPTRALDHPPAIEVHPEDLLQDGEVASFVADAVDLGGAPMSSWLLARLWRLTEGGLDLRTDRALWLQEGWLVLPLFGSDAAERQIAVLEIHLGREGAQAYVLPLQGAADRDTLRRSEEALVALLTAAPAQVAVCRILICDLAREREPWACGWDGARFLGGAQEYTYDDSEAGVREREPVPRSP